MSRLKELLKAFLLFVLAVLVQFGAALATSFIYGVVLGVKVLNDNSGDTTNLSEKITESLSESNILFITMAITTVVEVIVFGIWYYRKYGRVKQEVAYKEIFTLKNTGALLLIAFATHLLVLVILNAVLSRLPDVSEQYSALFNPIESGNVILVTIVCIVATPIGEECIFRGLILRRLNRAWGSFGAIFIQALLFGILHFNIVQGIYAFLLGIILGYVTLKLHSILPAILVHMIFNAGGIFIAPLFPEAILSSMWAVVLISVVCAFLIVYMLRRLKGIVRVQGEVQEEVAIVDNPEDSL